MFSNCNYFDNVTLNICSVYFCTPPLGNPPDVGDQTK
jgi:hypothetical protein